ncbi:histone-lysine N-methyltransferase SETMAR [Chanos chanos]|uniref:Histone-lysine N-methyltransferase SETMAR n=1 Tax=Chanos chanos TaxID=29144 RepID=A0A6J2VQ92_CHACN|nr:histone-lysine N-methyltransferase SETMAR [Chanos chanos]
MNKRTCDEDLSRGHESVPITIERNDGKNVYPNFQYTPENIKGPGCDNDPSEVTLPGCSCRSLSCQRESCLCLQSYGETYDREGRLLNQCDGATGYSRPVFECNVLCECSEACQNRVVQKGVNVPLCVFWTEARGWGVKVLEPVLCGTFVCEYAGEAIGFEEARRRQLSQTAQDMNYIIAVGEYAGEGQVSQTFVDPVAVGNVGRFINHSCQPNLIMVPVRVHSVVPRLALFARRDILANEELSFDYSGGHSSSEVERLNSVQSMPGAKSLGMESLQRKPCLCGAQNCAGFLPLDISVLHH